MHAGMARKKRPWWDAPGCKLRRCRKAGGPGRKILGELAPWRAETAGAFRFFCGLSWGLPA